jgi:hypothetical protein
MAKKVNKKRVERVKNRKERRESGGLFIPAGLFIGMGIGFLFNQLVEWLFIGLGVGFLLFALTNLMKNRN